MSKIVRCKLSPFFVALWLTLAMLLVPQPGDAQNLTRRDVPKGAVTGLEMGIEGSMRVVPGAHLRWFVTVYEIIKGRDIRPARGVQLRALASFHQQSPVATVTTDARGRASIDFEVPTSVEGPFNLVVEARSPKGVKRNFDVHVSLAERFQTELFLDRTEAAPGAEVRVWGRVFDTATRKPASGHEVTLGTRANRRLVGNRKELKTNKEGLFEALMRAPKVPGEFSVVASAEESARVVRSAVVRTFTAPVLIVRAQPTVLVAKPGTTIEVDVSVRTPDGRPVPRAKLSGLSIPEAKPGQKARIRPVLTDSQGRARVPWEVRSKAQLAEVTGTIHALREGIGAGNGDASVRVSRQEVLVSWSVEGGALIPGLPNRIVVRALHPDGTPWANLALELSGGRLAAASAQTDKDGAAVLEAAVGSRDPQSPPHCNGPTLAAATLRLGQHTRELCLPVDPDATIRVRAPSKVRAGSAVDLRLLAKPNVATLPVVITVLGRAPGTHWTPGSKSDHQWMPLAQTVARASQKQVQIKLPPEARGALWIRARPLLGAILQPVRGGTTMVWAHAGGDAGIKLNAAPSGTVQLASSGTGSATKSGFAIALPTAEGKLLLHALRMKAGNRPVPGAGDAEWQGFLAAQTPTDRAVSSVLRDGRPIALGMPEDSVSMGLLRDPWRTRARFVRGRLGRLIFAIEAHVVDSLPNRLQNVAVRGPKGWRFNSEILTVMANNMGIDAVAGLDGNPLSIADLQRLDSEFVYDNVARRITRERLMRVLIGMRQFVKTEQLDYQWARRGDPKTWLGALLSWDDPEGDFFIEAEQFYDAWGKPFAIRKAAGPRARFRFLEPIVGYEIVSAGPDGRFGTRDDLYDPFARVLKESSLYGEAVGEAALLARLRGVELGRATITALSEVFDLKQPMWESTGGQASRQSWGRPAQLREEPRALEAQAVGRREHVSSAFAALSGGNSQLKLQLSADPRRYLVVAGLYTSDGTSAFAEQSLHAGAPILIDASMPPRLRPNEPLKIPLQVIGLEKAQDLSVSASGSGPVEVELLGKRQFRLRAGESKTIYLRVLAKGVGKGTINLVFKAGDGTVIRKFEHSLPAIWDGSLRAQHTGVLADTKSSLEISMPSDALPLRSILVVTTAQDLLRDPGFTKVAALYPELMAWAFAMRGQEIPSALLDRLSNSMPRARPMPSLLKATGAAAWSAIEETPEIQAARSAAIGELRQMQAPASLRARSALLVALASGASVLGDSASEDPVASLVNKLRNDGWHAPRTEKSRPTVMARLAAGLLLADPEDMPGRELFDRATKKLGDGKHGGLTLSGEDGSEIDGWIGTVALAIAARQLGERKILAKLVGSIAPRSYLAMRGGVEPAFWLLAASAYGIFGIEKSTGGSVAINGKRHNLRFVNGLARFSLPNKSTKVVLNSAFPVLARLEARYIRPVNALSASSLRARIGGEVGHSGDTAALEIVVKNSSDKTVKHPVVEVILPSAAALSEPALDAIRSAAGVSRVEAPDRAGLLRIHLTALGAKRDLRVSLPVQWIGEGKVRGLAVTTYNASTPWLISSTPGRTIHLAPAPVETWK